MAADVLVKASREFLKPEEPKFLEVACLGQKLNRFLQIFGFFFNVLKHVHELTHILAPKENDALFTSERLAVCLDNRIKIAAGDVISKAINDNPPAPGILEATSFLPAYEAARKNKYNLD